MKVKLIELLVKTKEYLEIIDITDKVMVLICESGIKNGLVNIQTMHTTAAVLINTNEPLFLEDLKRDLENNSPRNLTYNHDDFSRRTMHMHKDESPNGHSHCKATHLPVNICLNLIAYELQLGTWQRIMFIELDKPSARKIQLQIMGE